MHTFAPPPCDSLPCSHTQKAMVLDFLNEFKSNLSSGTCNECNVLSLLVIVEFSVTLVPVVSGACTLFATHFSRLSELAAMYPNCKLWNFGVNDGLILANSVGIPEEVTFTD